MQQLCKIEHWVNSVFNVEFDSIAKLENDATEALVFGHGKLEKLKGDASSRCYYRLTSDKKLSGNPNYQEQSYIVVASPVDKIDNTIFIKIANHWREHGINTPLIYAADPNQGFMLIEDFGAIHLYDELIASFDRDLYQQAIKQLINIQKISATQLPSFDRAFLMREMNLFNQWMVEYQLVMEVPECVEQTFQILVKNALGQPQVTMHRDYHSRNLLLRDEKIAVIDFQDAVQGPLAYDLVSLLKDCYLDLSESKQNTLIDDYLLQLNRSNILSDEINKDEFIRWFDLIGMQRHLKVLGLFIRLGVEERKTGYLQDLPRVFKYVLAVAKKYPEFELFYRWLSMEVEPKLVKQSWYVS